MDTLLEQFQTMQMPPATFATANVKEALDVWDTWLQQQDEPPFFLWIRLNNESVFVVTRQRFELDLDPRAVVVQVVDVDTKRSRATLLRRSSCLTIISMT